MVLQLIFAPILTFIFIISQEISGKAEKYHQHLLSLSSGMFIAIIFIEIFPLITQASNVMGNSIFILMLAGFTCYHLIVKYTYQHTRGIKREKQIGYIHVVGFFLENFVNGFILTILIISGVSYIIFIPFLLVTLATSLSLKHLNDRFQLGNSKYLLSSSILIGTIVATVIQFSQRELYIILALMSGFLLYFVSRDMIPRGSYGKPLYFLFGVALVFLLLQLTSIIS